MITFLIFVGTILVLVGLHEAGHFFTAKAFGVYVKEFAIGFGPKLLAVRGKETRYTIRAIPFGGYVRMAGEDRRETSEEIPADRFLYNKPPLTRAIISLAGPFSNLLLAFLVTLVVAWSIQLPILQVADAIPGMPAEGTLTAGDRILSMNGRTVYTMDHITEAIQRSNGQAIAVDLVRGGENLTLSLVPSYSEDEARYLIGAYFNSVALTNELTSVAASSLFASVGLEPGDRIVAVEGEPVGTGVAFLVLLDERLPAEVLSVTIMKDERTFDVELPVSGRSTDDVTAGIEFANLGIDLHRANVMGGIGLAWRQFAGYVTMMAQVVRGIVTGNVAAGEVLQGPVGVARTLGQGLAMGPIVFFQLLAFLSLNFGLLNLVPFPALDGSRAAFALYESIRRRPIPPEREGLIHALGFLVLIGVMILITYQDIARLFR